MCHFDKDLCLIFYSFGAQVLSKAIVVKNIGIGGINDLNVDILPLPKLTSILRVEALE